MHLIFTYGVVGIVIGCLYALTASGLVVTYQTSGIFNLGHGAIGMFMAFTYWQLAVPWHVPWPIALLLVLFVAAPLSGALLERAVIRPLYGATLGVTLVVTLGILLALVGVGDAIWKPTITRHLPVIFPGQIHLPGVNVTYYQLTVLLVSVGVAVGLRVLFTRTRTGMTMRAVVDDRDLTARAGASPARMAQLSWALGASLAALAGILIAPLEQLDQINLTILVVTGYAAAVVGRLKSLPLTVAGALLLGLIQAYAVGYLPNKLLSDLSPAIPMLLLFGALIVLPQERLRTARISTGKTHRLTSLPLSIGLAAAFVPAVWLVSGMLSAKDLTTFGFGVVSGVVMLSLVLLTGYGGQVSLAQMTFAGLGAFAMGKIAGGVGLIAAVLFPAAVGAALAMVVLRLRGLYLALATLAFAYGMDSLFFNHFLGFGGTLNVARLGAQSYRGFITEIAVLFAAVAIGLLALRRGPFGRSLVAVNDSEVACASLGMNITVTKVVAFTLAAGIAGLGGAMLGGWQFRIGPDDVGWLNSLTLLLLITLAGIDTVGGAFAAAIFFAFRPILAQHVHIPGIDFLLIGLGAVSLGQNPGGFAGQMAWVADRLRASRVPRTARPVTELAGASR